jgi:hypothetical protein
VIEIPCPSKERCDELIAFLHKQDIFHACRANDVEPCVFSSVC